MEEAVLSFSVAASILFLINSSGFWKYSIHYAHISPAFFCYKSFFFEERIENAKLEK